MSFAEVNGLRLHFQSWGEAAGPGAASIMLVHGLGSSCHIWDLVGPKLVAQALRVLALDQRGHGESDQPNSGYDFASVVSDLAGFISAVGDEQQASPPVLVGHSWGASVVLQYAVAHPGRAAGLALVDGGISSPGEVWSWEETEHRLRPPDLDGMKWTDLHRRMFQNNGAYADPRAEAVGRSLFRIDTDGHVTRRFRISNHMQAVRALWEQRPAELLPRVDCPVLLLPARQPSDSSPLASAKASAVERALRLQPRARVRWLDDTVHDVPLQRPDELASELLGFTNEALRARIQNLRQACLPPSSVSTTRPAVPSSH